MDYGLIQMDYQSFLKTFFNFSCIKKMKVNLELFGASKDFSEKDHLELEVQDEASIDDLRNEIIKYIDKNFQGNENFIKVVKSSAFCSENNEIISDNYKITKDQKIGIIPPIGGG